MPLTGDVLAVRSIPTDEAAANNVLYDLQGRRVQTPAKGLYIRNGRKVMVK